MDALDDPVGTSLTGAHAHLAWRRGNVVCYPPELSPFMAVPSQPTTDDWADVSALRGEGAPAVIVPAPQEWEYVSRGPAVQLVGEAVVGRDDEEVVRLGPADVPEMLALVETTKPGPFAPRTIELGTYLGLRRDGVLVAMAGERMHPPGWSEISAVCTDPAARGQGLATRLVLAMAAVIRARGEIPFLHAHAGNTGAIRLYESLGFRLRRTLDFGQLADRSIR